MVYDCGVVVLIRVLFWWLGRLLEGFLPVSTGYKFSAQCFRFQIWFLVSCVNFFFGFAVGHWFFVKGWYAGL